MANYLETVEKSAKTVADAVSEALAALAAKENETTVEVLDEGHKGIFGLGSRPARVKVTLNYDPVRIAKRFILEMTGAMGLKVEVVAELEDNHLSINIVGDEDMGVLIGKRGQTLDSLQYIVNLAVNRGDEHPYVSVTLDTENYRKRRKETLEILAQNLAKKVKQTRKTVVLEPMSPYERRIIHAALQNDRFVTTYSEGEDPFRNVVIAMKKDQYHSSSHAQSQYKKDFLKKGYDKRPPSLDKKPYDRAAAKKEGMAELN